MHPPRALIIAGPNGAGKTTFASEFLTREAQAPTFINADLIAAGLSPFDPQSMSIRAGKLMLERIDECVKDRQTFSIETTLAGTNYVKRIQDWQEQGYHVKLYFLKLPEPEIAVSRVRLRVKLGGHHIPEQTIRRRFRRGWENFEQVYKNLVDCWQVYDATVIPPIVIEEGIK